jgi:uncharacterized protein YbaR (Trm112 family)
MDSLGTVETNLICVRCHEHLRSSETPWSADGLRGQWPALACCGCGASYPVHEGVPVIFVDDDRIRAVIDPEEVAGRVQGLGERMGRAAALTSDDLESLKLGDALQDSLSWEMYFWEHWKGEDLGVIDFDRHKIDGFLEVDREGGGRLAFLSKVVKYARGVRGKSLLNIGAGRDLLLERFLDEGCRVTEVDVILEPLVYLRRRRAHLCVCCDARQLPFENSAFHVTTSFGSLHHIWPIDETIAEMVRVTDGHVHLNEPNSYALTRLALSLPAALRNRLKGWYSEGHSRSPYEGCISPLAVKRAVVRARGRTVNMSFPRSSWVSPDARGLRKLVRLASMAVVGLLPFTSSHFDAVVRTM